MPGLLLTAGVGMTGAATIAAPAAGFATTVVVMKGYEDSGFDRAYNAGVDFLAKYGEPALASATRMVVERHVGAYKAVRALGARLTSSVFGGSTKTNPVQPSIKKCLNSRAFNFRCTSRIFDEDVFETPTTLFGSVIPVIELNLYMAI